MANDLEAKPGTLPAGVPELSEVKLPANLSADQYLDSQKLRYVVWMEQFHAEACRQGNFGAAFTSINKLIDLSLDSGKRLAKPAEAAVAPKDDAPMPDMSNASPEELARMGGIQ